MIRFRTLFCGLVLVFAFSSWAADKISENTEKYSTEAFLKLADAARNIETNLIVTEDYCKPAVFMLGIYKKHFDKVRKSLIAELDARKDLSLQEKSVISESINTFIDNTYSAFVNSYNNLDQDRAAFIKNVSSARAELDLASVDSQRVNKLLNTFTSDIIERLYALGKQTMENAGPHNSDWQKKALATIETELAKLKSENAAMLNSTDYPVALKRLLSLYGERLTENFRNVISFEICGHLPAPVRNVVALSDPKLKYKVTTDFFGLYMGDSKSEVLKNFKNSKLIAAPENASADWAEVYKYASNPNLKNAEETSLYFCDGLLVKTEIVFVANSKPESDAAFKQFFYVLQSKYGTFDVIDDSDIDPLSLEKYRTLTPEEQKRKSKPLSYVKYIWCGASNMESIKEDPRGNLEIKITQVSDTRFVIVAENETLLRKAETKFRFRSDAASLKSF